MEDTSALELRFPQLYAFTTEDLEGIVSSIRGTLTVKMLCPSIGRTQSYMDVAIDLLEALFVGESIAEFSENISYYEDDDGTSHQHTINFVLTPQNPAELAKKLHELSALFIEGDEENEEERIVERNEVISDFQSKIGLFEKKDCHFPLLLDDYFANYILGLEEESDPFDDISEIDTNDPVEIHSYIHQKYGYIQSMNHAHLEHDLYYSTENNTWIILSDSPIEITTLGKMLAMYRKHVAQPFEMQEASVIATDSFDTVAFNQVEAITYPFEHITRAQKCVEEIYLLKRGEKIDETRATKVERNLLSSYGDVLLVLDHMAQYIFFNDVLSTISPETLKNLAQTSPPLNAYLNNLQANREQRAQKLITSSRDQQLEG